MEKKRFNLYYILLEFRNRTALTPKKTQADRRRFLTRTKNKLTIPPR